MTGGATAVEPAYGMPTFQPSVQPWLLACFGEMIAFDRDERNHRFLEEALELVQSCGCTAREAHQLVDYVYERPVGELHQEIGGVMVTLAALCLANDADMHAAGWVELNRIWGRVEQIRAKQSAKPKHSPLPVAPTTTRTDENVVVPREPTEKMLRNYAPHTTEHDDLMRAIWSAMLVAAPVPTERTA